MLNISKAVIKKGEKFLLLKRVTHSKSYPDLWDFAGGKDNVGESHTQSVVRETKEETSLDIDPGIEIKNEEYHDEKHDLIFHYFIPQILSEEISLSSDHDDFVWTTKEEIQKLKLHPAVKLFFK